MREGIVARYESEIVIGSKYRDRQTGLMGTAVVISFHQHACERVVLEGTDTDVTDLKMWEFDAARLVAVGTPLPQPEPVATGATNTSRVKRSGRRS